MEYGAWKVAGIMDPATNLKKICAQGSASLAPLRAFSLTHLIHLHKHKEALDASWSVMACYLGRQCATMTLWPESLQ